MKHTNAELTGVCLVLQGSLQGNHNYLCFHHLPVGAPQPVDDAVDSTENRRGQHVPCI